MIDIIKLTKKYPKHVSLFSGFASGLVYAPTYFMFLWCGITFLTMCIYFSKTYKQAFIFGFLFGFGHFLTSIYWISFAIMVYVNDFWWFVPIALFGLPTILGVFIGFSTCVSRFSKDSRFFPLIFAMSWLCFEYIRSFIFTGFPWNLAGYSLSFSDIVVQIVSKISVYGLSFFIIYIFSGCAFYFIKKNDEFIKHLVISLMLTIIVICFGIYRTNKYVTEFTEHKVRIVQASIKQEDKWSMEKLIDNLNEHIFLSKTDNGFNPEIILWSESSVPFPINFPETREYVKKSINSNQILITGSISDNGQCDEISNCQMFVSFSGINDKGEIVLSYEKRHLVPFGEYVPFKNLLLIKKITNGFIDFSTGHDNYILSWKNLKIRPLICYEAIFPDEILSTNHDTDVLINVTNDAWYGNIGPYQHFAIARMRSIETGIPMIRVANNGISAIIDPIGRIVNQTLLNEIRILDGYIPKKIKDVIPSNYQKYKYLILTIIIIFVILLLNVKKLNFLLYNKN